MYDVTQEALPPESMRDGLFDMNHTIDHAIGELR
jgi:hypothetical protein